VAKISNRVKASHYCNVYDKEIVEALERLLIFESKKTGSIEHDKADRDVLRILRLMFVFVVVFSVMRIFFAIGGEDQLISGFHKMTTTFFFGLLFIMLHIETNNQSRILLFLACTSLLFSLW